jgi:hypothetical protein
VPWRGPQEPGEFPTLGYAVGEWIEANCVIPDGYRKGDPYLLTDEMWRFLVQYYRLDLDGVTGAFLRHYGGQLRRSQKWGKDPFGAAIICAESFGPARFDGWDANGEPVGVPYPTPYIPVLGTSEEQTDNTWLALLPMIREGPLVNLPGVDAGETRITVPGGKIEPVTASARARLGGRVTFATFTETHLWVGPLLRRLGGAMKRNIAGMDGRWLELTNAWDPTENSEAQATAADGSRRVYIDSVSSQRVSDLADEDAVYRELLRQYGDSAAERGGWVNIRGRIMDEIRSTVHTEADRRRFFLNEEVVGESPLADQVTWAKHAKREALAPGEQIALGFDGSKRRDATALIASRISDGKLFVVRIWPKPDDADKDWRVPTADVDRVVRETFEAYRVAFMLADPYLWQDYLDTWSALFPDRIADFPTNSEQRMDAAIERFVTSFGNGEIQHASDPELTDHVLNTVIVKGNRKKIRPGEDPFAPSHYMKLGKKVSGDEIDGAVAAVLAHHARGYAIENDLLVPDNTPEVWIF